MKEEERKKEGREWKRSKIGRRNEKRKGTRNERKEGSKGGMKEKRKKNERKMKVERRK